MPIVNEGSRHWKCLPPKETRNYKDEVKKKVAHGIIVLEC